MESLIQQFIASVKQVRDSLIDIPKKLLALQDDIKQQTIAIQKASDAAQQHYDSPPMVRTELYVPDAEKDEKKRFIDEKKWLGRLQTLLAALTLAAIVWYACVAHRQWTAMLESNRINRDALQSVQRAFVSVTPIETSIVGTNPQNGGVEILMKWENSGTTPTREMLEHISYAVRRDPLPDDFDFPDIWREAKARIPDHAVIGPKGAAYNFAGPVPYRDIEEWQLGHTRIFVWAWAEYHDVFDTTPVHVTKYCGEMIMAKRPKSAEVAEAKKLQSPPGWEHVTLRFESCGRHNCYDEECRTQQ